MYKHTGGNTTTLHNHLKRNHLNRLDDSKTEVNRNRGTMDKFVVNAIPVSFDFFILFLFI